MNDILSGINWEEDFDKYPLDVNKKWNYFKEKFAAAEAECVPRKMVYTRINGKYTLMEFILSVYTYMYI